MARGSGGPVGAKTKKVAGSSTGVNGAFEKNNYGAGPIPKSMLGAKPGIADKGGPYGKGYTGPDVQRGEFP